MVKFIIADPSLIDNRGHHYSLTLQLARGAARLGLDVILLVNRSFNVTEELTYKVLPIFSMSMYDRYKPELKDKLPDNKDDVLLGELLHALRVEQVVNGDHVFFHTGYGDLYKAVDKLFQYSSTNIPYIHICTPYEIETMPGKDPGDNIANVFQRYKERGNIDSKLYLWAETPQLASSYSSRFHISVRALPLPTPAYLDDHEFVSERRDVFTALYLGAARDEKGFTHIPKIVEELFEEYGKKGKLKFVIQCTPQIIGYLPEIKSAIRELERFPTSYVNLIKDSMSESDYHRELMKSDLLLLLYDKKSYRLRGSGIAVEAVCSNKCILTHKGTFCESLITHGGGEAVINVSDASRKLAKMIDNFEEYRSLAEKQGYSYRNTYSIVNYITRVLSQTEVKGKPRFLPSLIMGKINKPLIIC